MNRLVIIEQNFFALIPVRNIATISFNNYSATFAYLNMVTKLARTVSLYAANWSNAKAVLHKNVLNSE